MSKLMAGQLESVFVVDCFANTTKSSNHSLADQGQTIFLFFLQKPELLASMP